MKVMSGVVLILGMHRSGTSCLAGSFQENGVYFPEVSIENKFNKKGNRENSRIMKLNDDILLFNSSAWNSPPKKELVWNSAHEEVARDILNTFLLCNESKLIGFKDPRFILTFDFWDKVLGNPILVGTIRNPLAVAASLNRRDNNISIDQGINLWLAYNEKLLGLLQKKSFPLISFDLEEKEYIEKLKSLISILSIGEPFCADFFEQGLRNSYSNEGLYSLDTNV